MDPERWLQIGKLYRAALERDPNDRDSFLADACAGDSELRDAVNSLLAPTKTTETLSLDAPAPQHEAGHSSRHPWWMYLIAASFLAHALFITSFYFFGPESMGIDATQVGNEFVVSYVDNASPAERGGIKPGDLLVRANGHSIPDTNYWYWFFTNVEVGKPIVLETERQGRSHYAVLTLNRRPLRYWFTGEGCIILLNLSGRYIALVVACLLAWLRPRSLVACTGALVLGMYAAVELVLYDGINSTWRQSPFWFQSLLWLANAIGGLGWGVWFTFFALFPRPSFRARWIWALIWTPALLSSLEVNYQAWHMIYNPERMIPSAWMSPVLSPFMTAYVLGSFVVLAIKYRRLETETEKRRVRLVVISLGLLIALAIPVVVYSQADFRSSPGASLFLSFPARALANLAYAAFPACFAWSILRRRLFDIRVVIRQGIRYAAARQLLLLAAPAIIAVFLIDVYAHRDRRVDTIVHERGAIYLGLAALVTLAHIRRHHWLQSLDRHFFRERYNAQEILRTTLQQVTTAGSLAEVAPTVARQIEATLHPSFCAIVEQDRSSQTYSLLSIYPTAKPHLPIAPASRAVELARVIGKPVQVASGDGWLARQLPPGEMQYLEHCGVDLIAPVKGRNSGALIVLGRKRSEEPYTSDDLRLIEDVSIGLGLLPSRRFPDQRFKLESRIGHGGMGAVYEAIDLQLSRKVAIKLISESLIADSAALERFEREARILAAFQHPNVVTLFDAGVMQDGRPFLAMERLQGRTLREELNMRARLSGDEVRSIVRQLCAGLSAAHRRSLIHRDLKPENIFLCEYETDRVVKILDFGLAKLLESPASVQHGSFSTLTGHVVGTPAYMSPELLSGAKPDSGCDIWALAVITCELLTGERSAGGNLQHVPGCWREFFNRSLAQEQRHRPETVTSFLEQFERCAATIPPATRSSGTAAF